MSRDAVYSLMAAMVMAPIVGICAINAYTAGDLGGPPAERERQLDSCVAIAERDYYAAAIPGELRPDFRANPGFLGAEDSPADAARAACEFELAQSVR